MKTKSNILRPDMLNGFVKSNSEAFISNEFVFFRNMLSAVKQSMLDKVNFPQYVEVGRLTRVLSGTATFRINLLPYNLQKGDVFIITENTYIEITDVSADFNVQAFSFKHLPISFPRSTQLRLSTNDFERVGRYMDLIWEVLHKENFSMQTVEYLQSALFNDLKHIQQQSEKQSTQQRSRSEQIMQRFLDLVAEFGATQRNVKFYAEQLLLTPNHLSAVVRQQSGQTVMQWLNERTILQAKVLLKHSDLSNSEIAFQLGFKEATLFSRFFRRETGMTPKEYRKRVP